MKNKPFNGHKNWNHWNVSLWINNDEGLYRTAQFFLKNFNPSKDARGAAAQAMMDDLRRDGITETPDGAPYSVTTIRAAMRGM
jgi:hypothetical protein